MRFFEYMFFLMSGVWNLLASISIPVSFGNTSFELFVFPTAISFIFITFVINLIFGRS